MMGSVLCIDSYWYAYVIDVAIVAVVVLVVAVGECEIVDSLPCRRLLDKQQKVEAIIADIPAEEEQQRKEVEEMITPAERNQLRQVKLQTHQ